MVVGRTLCCAAAAAAALLTGVPAAAAAAVTATVRPCLLNNTNVAELRSWSFQALCHLDTKSSLLSHIAKSQKILKAIYGFLPL